MKSKIKTRTYAGRAPVNTKSKKQNILTPQTQAVIMMAFGILLGCMLFINGGGAWKLIKETMIGIFGFMSYSIPIVICAQSILTALNNEKISAKSIISVAIVISLFTSFIFIISVSDFTGYFENIKIQFLEYRVNSSVMISGALGAFFGGLIMMLTGYVKTPAIAIVVVLIFWILAIKYRNFINKTFDSVYESHYISNKESVPGNNQPKTANKQNKNKKLDFKSDIENDNKKVSAHNIVKKTSEKVDKEKIKDKKVDKVIKEPDAAKIKEKENIKKCEIKRENIKEEAANIINKNTSDTNYYRPPLDCLKAKQYTPVKNYEDELKNNERILVDTLMSFGVETKPVGILRGPSVTQYALQPASGIKISRITNLSDDIALNLATSGIRIEAPIPNKAAVGIEVPNKIRDSVTIREIIEGDAYKNSSSKLNIALGKNIEGKDICCDLSKMPHLLIAGTTGSGKSVCLNTMIVSLLYNSAPDEVKIILIDPKQVEFLKYNGLPHLLIPVVSEPKKASGALAWAVSEMLKRYSTFSDNGARDIDAYNQQRIENGSPKMPRIVIFIDELADLMMAAPNEVEDSICRLAQMARAAGMHLVVATQRPSADIITGLIKSNIPSRIALSVSSQINSRIIIDTTGAEKLLGNGDMLYMPMGIAKPIRLQGCFVSSSEIDNVVDFIKSQTSTEYDEEIQKNIDKFAENTKKTATEGPSSNDGEMDEMTLKAIDVIIDSQTASTSYLQRKLKVGYARAARIIDELEAMKIVGTYDGGKPRKVLYTRQQWDEINNS